MRDIVYLSRVPWDSIYQRPQHLAVGLARCTRLLYVDTPRSTLYRRLFKPLLSHQHVRPFLWQPEPGLTVLSPAFVPFLPGWWPPPGQYALSRIFLRWSVHHLGMHTPIVWTQEPRDVYFLDTLSPCLVCYDCMDDYALIAPSAKMRPTLRAQESIMLKRADVVFASSNELAQRCRQSNANVTLLPNGVDAGRFAETSQTELAPDLSAIPAPRIGFVGSLASWLDFDLLAAIATARPHWSIVLVGPVLNTATAEVVALRRLPNVHVLGERPYASIPSYLSGFTVCLIPFRLNDLTRAVNPVKFYEYMAAARPVVSTPLPELAPYASVCTLAHGSEAFIAGIEAAMVYADDPVRRRQRRAVALANGWSQRVQTARDVLAAALEQ